MRISKACRRIISFIENPDVPFLYYVLAFFSWVTLRNFLEIFSDQAKISFRLFPASHFLYFLAWQGLTISMLHYYVFWIALFLASAILLFFITKEEINVILKSLFSFSFIISLTPLFDLLLSKGRGFDIRYAYPKSIFEFLPYPHILTPGMLLTSCLAIALSFIYCRAKTESFKRGLLGGLGLYALLLFASVLPFLLKVSHPVPIIRFMTISILIELLVIFYLRRKEYFLALFKGTRLCWLFHFEFMFILGIFLTGPHLKKLFQQEFLSFLLTLSGISLAWVVAVILNNLATQDRNIGRVIPLNVYKKIGACCFGLAVLCSAVVNFSTLFFILLGIGNSVLYSLPPLRLKRVPLFSKLFISFNSLLLVMLGYIFAGGELLRFPSVIIWYFLIFITLCLNFMDLKDYAQDKKAGILTLPVILGLNGAKLIIAVFFLIAYSILGWVFLDLRLLVPGMFLGTLQFFLINKRAYREKWISALYVISVILVLIYLWTNACADCAALF